MSASSNNINRREFASTAADAMPTLYYMDGYHGGAVGHMPLGCWRDILETMRLRPDWKLSLDVEAPSWAVLKREDPESFQRLSDYVEDREGKGRVEIVGGTLSQSYGWAITGESNIRQLQHGLKRIHERFGNILVETYAVQEPCWSSCLPQILRSLGFTGASLKNASTAWGGYTEGMDAELVNWIGPDGTSIVAVPRYKCEDLLKVWETEATEATAAYARKCVELGIPEPAGMCFQDLEWAAQPRVQADWIRYATWREYIHKIAHKAPVHWAFSMEDIQTALPWGEKTLHRVAQQVRAAEVSLAAAEKHASLAYLKNRSPWPAERLQEAWEQALWTQDRDAWITATTRTGRRAWSFQVASNTINAANTAQDLIDAAAISMSEERRSLTQIDSNVQYLRAINSSGQDRDDLVGVSISSDR
jgi:alpha-mannosidase